MLTASDPRFQYCTRVATKVRICRSESECRREYGCTKPNCPLQEAFGLQAYDERMRAFASVFDLWPMSDAEQADFP